MDYTHSQMLSEANFIIFILRGRMSSARSSRENWFHSGSGPGSVTHVQHDSVLEAPEALL